MLLVVDVGNTNTVLGVYEVAQVGFVKQSKADPRMIAHWRVATIKNHTVDEYGVLFRNLFSIEKIDAADVRGIIISSILATAPRVTITLSARMRLTGSAPATVTTSTKGRLREARPRFSSIASVMMSTFSMPMPLSFCACPSASASRRRPSSASIPRSPSWRASRPGHDWRGPAGSACSGNRAGTARPCRKSA